MRAGRLAALAAGALLGLSTLATSPASALEIESWIVTLEDGLDPGAQASALAATAGGDVEHVYTSVLGGFAFAGTSLQAATLGALPGVESVVADGEVSLGDSAAAGQPVPTGVARVSGPLAHAEGYTGAGVTVAVIDSGIDLLHPDLSPNLHPTLGANCIEPLVPAQDDNSHGTHVAGSIAAADNGLGVIGVAPSATLVPVKAFDAAGDSTWAKVICGIDYVASHASEVDVANMSFGDLSTVATACDGVTTSDIDALRQAVCDLSEAGVIPVAAAGNNMIDTAGFVPASFPEPITVSALSDTDGQPGGLGGCIVFGAICDDGFASLFSNHGPRVDVMAPGFEILSTMPGGTYGLKDGTSMAAPHATGAVALLLQADPHLSASAVRSILQRSGECPDGSAAGGDSGCDGQGAWPLDPDAEPEPLVHALRAAQLAAGAAAPVVEVITPTSGSTVAGTVTISVHAADDKDASDTLDVQVRVDGGSWLAAPWNADAGRHERPWDTRFVANGSHTIEARAADTAGRSTVTAPVSVSVLNGMHVGDLDGTRHLTKRSWSAKVTVAVHDLAESAVEGASVTVRWSDDGSTSGTCVIKHGICVVTSPSLSPVVPSVTATITDVSRAGQTYTPSLNHDVDGSSDGTTVTVSRV